MPAAPRVVFHGKPSLAARLDGMYQERAFLRHLRSRHLAIFFDTKVSRNRRIVYPAIPLLG